MIAALLSRAGLTLDTAAELIGVTSRTVRNWRDGKSRVPASALRALEYAAAEADMAETESTPQTLAERIAALQAIQAMQRQAAHRLEDELAEARLAHGQTTSTLNALYAERGKLEKSDD